MDVHRYIYHYDDFYEKSLYQTSINNRIVTTTQETCKHSENSLISSLSLLVKSYEEEI